MITYSNTCDVAVGESELLRGWIKKVTKQFDVKSVHVESVNWVGRGDERRPLFIKINVDASVKDTGRRVPGIVFLRGDTVAILVVLVFDWREYVVLVSQPRLAVGEASYLELPAGIIEHGECAEHAALRELEEETGIKVETDLVNLNEALRSSPSCIYSSAGACNEGVTTFLYRQVVSNEFLDELESRHINGDGEETIQLEVLPLYWVGDETLSMKVHSALHMYRMYKEKIGYAI